MSETLRRDVGLTGAMLLGLGSILGTGAFVSLGLAAGVTGPAALLGVFLAGLLAAANGLSSAQLAAAHPVSGGTYEYAHRLLHPNLGMTAGSLFLIAKSASAATAALGFAGYLATALGWDGSWVRLALAEGVVAVLTWVAIQGLGRSNRVNAVLVATAVIALAAFVVAGLPVALGRGDAPWKPFFAPEAGEGTLPALLHATALLFVAYTGYGRIATLGEEVRDPRRTLPRAILTTLAVSALLYGAVTAVAVGASGAPAFAAAAREEAAPLEVLARGFGTLPGLPQLLALGAFAALLGVLLNLLLGLSRVLLAMARRGDAPRALARLSADRRSPPAAVLVVAAAVAILVLLGDVRWTWSLSAFTVLLYYALTNLAALRLPVEDRRFPRWIAWAGLLGCLSLAVWIELWVWVVGLGFVALAVGGRILMRRLA